MRWNESGVPGHGDDKVVLYRNDVDVGTYFESAGAVWPAGFTDGLKLNLADGGLDLDLIYDDIRVYDVALSDQEIIELCGCP